MAVSPITSPGGREMFGKFLSTGKPQSLQESISNQIPKPYFTLLFKLFKSKLLKDLLAQLCGLLMLHRIASLGDFSFLACSPPQRDQRSEFNCGTSVLKLVGTHHPFVHRSHSIAARKAVLTTDILYLR